MHRIKPSRLLWFQNLPRSFQGLLLGAFISCAIGGISGLGLFETQEHGLLDTLFRARGPLGDPDPAIVIVAVDDRTVAAIDRWPLPRRYYADLVQRIAKAGAKTIAFDFVFSTPSDNPVDDSDLENACKTMGHVIPAAVFNGAGQSIVPGSSGLLPTMATGDSSFLKAGFAVTNRGASARSADWVTTALPELDDLAPIVGQIDVFPEMDGKLRKIPNLIGFRGSLYPSLALAATADYLNLRSRDIVATPHEVHIAGRTIPIDKYGETWVNWTGGNNAFPTYSMTDVLNGRVDPSIFRGRLVLIGSSASGAYEFHATPYSPAQPAVELQANAIDNILSNRPLRQLPSHLSWLLAVLFPVFCGGAIAPRRAASGTLFIFGFCGILLLCLLIALTQNLYIPAGAPLVAAALTYAAVTAVNYRREWESNFQVDAAVATLARGGALMASGSDRATLVAVIRRTAKTALGAFEVFVLLDDSESEFLLQAAEEKLTSLHGSLLWPRRAGATVGGTANTAETNRLLDELLQQVCARVETEQRADRHQVAATFRTIVAAPINFSSGLPERDDATAQARESAHGMLLAVGRHGGGVFTQRDVTLLENLAEQAGLAFKNLAYYERLQGRIELANRDLRQAYQLLAEQSAKLAAAVESINDALIVTDAGGNAVFENNASGRILGNAAPRLGESVSSNLRAHGFSEIADLFAQASAQENPDQTFQCELVHGTAETERRMLAATLTPLQNGDGTVLGAMLVVADITAQRQLEQMKTDFVSYVAHELRTPLTTILGYASLLHDSGDQFAQPQRAEMASAIMNHCQRLNRMITEMLDIARLDAGQALSLKATHFDFGQLAESVIAAQRTSLRGPRQYTLRLHAPEQPVIVEADRDRVEQILTNLLSNAVKYSPDGGEINLHLADFGRTIEFTMSDTGMGMNEDQLSHLFQKFYRASDAMARGIKGTGLGLFLVKQLVDAHHGNIEAHSRAGQGTTFTVTLPKQSGDFSIEQTEMAASLDSIPVVR